MGGKVVIKFGGGLITDKENMCTPNLDVIDSLVDILSKIEKQIILVHGAGSFGHMKAKKARLAEGRLPDLNQDIFVHEVREDMLLLNKYLTDSIQRYDLDYSKNKLSYITVFIFMMLIGIIVDLLIHFFLYLPQDYKNR